MQKKTFFIATAAFLAVQSIAPLMSYAQDADPADGLEANVLSIANGAESQAKQSGATGAALVTNISASVEDFLISQITAGIPGAKLKQAVCRAKSADHISSDVSSALGTVCSEAGSLLAGVHSGSSGGGWSTGTGDSYTQAPPPVAGGQGYRR